MKKLFRFGQKEKEILKMIALGTVVLASLALPNLPLVLKPFLEKKGPKNFKKVLKNLESKGVISLGGEKVVLTEKGRKLLQRIRLTDMEIIRPKKWDKIWRLVAYDVPDTHKKERDWFRFTLKRLGFYEVQESLWTHPFECKEEIAIIAKDLRISLNVIYMQTDHLPIQEKLEEMFGLAEI